MITIPSASRLILPAIVVFGLVLGYRLVQLGISTDKNDLISAFLQTQIQHGTTVNQDWGYDGPDNVQQLDATLFLPRHTRDARPNPYTKWFLRCSLQPNPFTSHVRIPNTSLREIKINPPARMKDEVSFYFNPTLIPLPSSSRYQYLVLSRLVTSGLHQESHICPATFTSPDSSHGESIECAMPAQRLNIPPTPAWRCEGSWAPFADIPGFHDPRVFWSGTGEPLVIVNSGSKSIGGCVGLWVVDLRAVVPDLRKWLSGDKAKEAENGDGQSGDRVEHASAKLDAKMSYSHLTELTKNPRSSRSSVEKNWVMFFPKAEESWVMYNLLGTPIDSSKTHSDGDADKREVGGTAIVTKVEDTNTGAWSENSGFANASHLQINVSIDSHDNSSSSSSHELRRSSGQIGLTGTNKQGHPLAVGPDQSLKTRALVIPQRTLAKIIGSGFTTTNLTSPFEKPCFDMTHMYDALGNQGHWHQGSNALRLVLCHRPGRRRGSDAHSEQAECTLTVENEHQLVDSGRVVHFMILHRKFSNALDLPLRYERFLIVWEARQPFRVLGVSRHPLLFATERAMPWTDEENWVDADGNMTRGAERRWRNETGFTYTPSLAWAWRKKGYAEWADRAGDLGTGYIDDDIIISVGMDDIRQGFVRLRVDDVLGCLRLCPDFDTPVEKEDGDRSDRMK